MNDSRYTVVDYLSLSPSQCIIYPKFFRNNPQEFSKREGNRLMQLLENGPESKNKTSVMPASNKHNFQLSKSAAKNLQSKVEWLYHFAKKKTIVTDTIMYLSMDCFMIIRILTSYKFKNSQLRAINALYIQGHFTIRYGDLSYNVEY